MHRYRNTYFEEPAEPHYPRVSHQQTQTVRYECSKCDSLFTSRLYLHQHEATVHDIIFLCPFCPALFSNKLDFRTHVEAHTEKKYLPCSFCKKEFDEKEEYEAHLKEHLEPCLFPCDFCPALFAQYSMLRAHNAIHVQKKFIHTISKKLERKQKRLSKKILKKLKSRSHEAATHNEECQTENHQPAESAVSVDAGSVASNPVVDSLLDDDEGTRSGPRSAANSNRGENIRGKRKSLSKKSSKKLKSSSHETAAHNQECLTENQQPAESAVSVDAGSVASNPVVDSLLDDDEGTRSGPRSAAISNQGENIRGKRKSLSKKSSKKLKSSSHETAAHNQECQTENQQPAESAVSVDAGSVASNPVVDSLLDDDEGTRSGPRSAAISNQGENIRGKRKSLSKKSSKKLKSSSHETATHNQECQKENQQPAESAVSVDAGSVASNPVVDSLLDDDEGTRSGPRSAAISNQGENIRGKRKSLSKKSSKKLKSSSHETAAHNQECQTENQQPAESAVSVDAGSVASNPVVDSLLDDDEGTRSGPRSAAISNQGENIRGKRKSLSKKSSKKLKSSSHETAAHNQECQTENHQSADSAVSVDATLDAGVASNPVVESLPYDDEGIRSGPESAVNSNHGENIRKRGPRNALNSNHGKNMCKRECRRVNESSRRSDASVSTSVPTFNNSSHNIRRSLLAARKTAKKISRQNSCRTQTSVANEADDEIPATSTNNNVAEKHSETDVQKKLRPRNTLKILNRGFSLTKPKVNCTYNFRRRLEGKSVYDESTSPIDDEVEMPSSSGPSSSSHTNSSKGFFMCLSCNRMFLTYRLLNQHKDLHLEKKGSRCNKCGGLFGGPGNLAAHKRSSLCGPI